MEWMDKNRLEDYGSIEVEETYMFEWLLDMKMRVKEVIWDEDKKGCYAVIGIEESSIWGVMNKTH